MNRKAVRSVAVFLGILAVLLVGGLVVDEVRNAGSPERTTVTVVGQDGSDRGTLEVQVASSYRERYVGLSNTDALGPNEGMLFVHENVEEHGFVMRDMDFPIDIVFVGPDRRITEIYHAETEERPYTRYAAVSKWTIETPYNWTVERNVTAGDEVRIEYADD